MASRSEGAVAAALAVARQEGIRCDEPVVLRDLTNVLVHLAPAPVVARVPLTLSLLRGRDWYATEVAVALHAAALGAPVVPPFDGADPGPHERDGYLVSLWAFVDHDPARFEARAAGRSLRELHLGLADYPGALPACERLDEIGRLLAWLRPSQVASENDLDALRRTHALLAAQPPVRSARRPLHGDSHFRNILWTRDGPLWTDLENACSGPAEYDLACVAWRAWPGTEEALSAYGQHDAALVEALFPYVALFLAAWTIVIAERVPTGQTFEGARERIERAIQALEM